MNVAEHDSVLPRDLIQAYRQARYRVHQGAGFTLAVNQYSAELAALLHGRGAESAVFITAWNPLGVALRAEENESRQLRLCEDLQARGLRAVPARGCDANGAWEGEDSLLVPGVSRFTTCELGRLHEQNAVLWSGADAIPRLLLLR